MKNFLLLLSFSLLSFNGFSQKLSKTKKIIKSGYYTNPVVSPTGEYALTTTENLNGVYLFNLKTKEINQISKAQGSGYGYTWSSDGQTFFYKEKQEEDYMMNAIVKSYNVITKTSVKIDINPNYLPSYKGNIKENPIVVYTNLSTLKIEAIDLVSKKSWIITNDEGQFYNAILSHDQKSVAVHNGADIYVYPIEGASKGQKIGTGIATAWSKNDTYLIGFLDESIDGHQISNSDLYLFDVKQFKAQKITTSEEAFEMFPCFYGNDEIMYADDKSGQLLTSKIKF